MNHLHRLLIASTLGLSLAGNALADRGDHREQRDNRVVIRSVDGGHHHHHDNRHPQRATRNHWLGPAAVLAIGGLTLGAIAYNSPPRPVIYSCLLYTSPSPRD